MTLARISTLLAAFSFAALGAAPARADKPAPPAQGKPADKPADKPAGPEHPGSHPEYDPATVETLRGEVVEVKRVTPRMPMMAKRFGKGIHLMVKTDKETLEVHLGPAPYVEKQDVKVSEKDRIEVKGSRITIDGKPVILAAEVTKDGKMLPLRAADGTPRWKGMFGPPGPHEGHGPHGKPAR